MKLDKKFLSEINASEAEVGKNQPLPQRMKRALIRFRIKINQRKKDEYDARGTNYHDAVCRALVTVLFPRKVNHLNKSGKQAQIDFADYLTTHFSFANGQTTPRVILLFLQSCLEKSRAYYRSNLDQHIVLNDKGEYPVFLRDQVSAAYAETRELCLKTIVGLNREFERYAMTLIQAVAKSRNPAAFSYADAKRYIGKALGSKGDPDETLQRFMAFYEHAGLFRCSNRGQVVTNRTYEVPIFFQGASPNFL